MTSNKTMSSLLSFGLEVPFSCTHYTLCTEVDKVAVVEELSYKIDSHAQSSHPALENLFALAEGK